MDLQTLVMNIRDMVAAFKAGNKFGAMLMLIQIVRDVAVLIPPPQVGVARSAHPQVMSGDENSVCDQLDALCISPVTPTSVGAPSTPVEGPFIDKVLPLLMVLLKKWLGV